MPVEPDRARALIERIADSHPSDRSLPRNFSEWRRKLLADPAEGTPGDLAREKLGSGSGDDGVARVVTRLEAGVLGPWPPGAAQLGAVIAPPMPAFYNQPKTIDDLVNHSVGRVLDLFDIDAEIIKRWEGSNARLAMPLKS